MSNVGYLISKSFRDLDEVSKRLPSELRRIDRSGQLLSGLGYRGERIEAAFRGKNAAHHIASARRDLKVNPKDVGANFRLKNAEGMKGHGQLIRNNTRRMTGQPTKSTYWDTV